MQVKFIQGGNSQRDAKLDLNGDVVRNADFGTRLDRIESWALLTIWPGAGYLTSLSAYIP
jgi:hypothetical protein